MIQKEVSRQVPKQAVPQNRPHRQKLIPRQKKRHTLQMSLRMP